MLKHFGCFFKNCYLNWERLSLKFYYFSETKLCCRSREGCCVGFREAWSLAVNLLREFTDGNTAPSPEASHACWRWFQTDQDPKVWQTPLFVSQFSRGSSVGPELGPTGPSLGFPGGPSGREPSRQRQRHETLPTYMRPYLPTWNPSQLPGLGRSPGGGHGSPLQYSFLGNPMDIGAWRARVHGAQRGGHNWNRLAHTHTQSSFLLTSLSPWLAKRGQLFPAEP